MGRNERPIDYEKVKKRIDASKNIPPAVKKRILKDLERHKKKGEK